MIQYPHTLKNNIYHSNKRRPPPFFHSWLRSDPFCWQKLCSGCNSEIDFVVVLELLSFNFNPIPNKSLKFTRFRKSYVMHPAGVLIKFTLLFYLMCAVQSSHFLSFLFFLQLLVSNDSAFVYTIFVQNTCCSNVVNFKQTKRYEIVIHKYIKAKSWS